MANTDRLSVIVSAALAEGLSYGKYMQKYNYDPPCLKNPPPRASPKKQPTRPERNYPPRNCRHCGNSFTPHHNSQVYCAPECQKRHKLEQYKTRYALENPKQERFCAVCGKPLPPDAYSYIVTCSPECRTIRAKTRKLQAQRRRKEQKC